jgi:uroporphyrinogen decarboxylase
MASNALTQSVFLQACRRQKTPYVPVWLMRQAGRYQKFYRAIRRRVSFIDLCKNSDLAAEVTVRAQRSIGADAAIIFSDILLILEPLGFKLRYEKTEGPLVTHRLKPEVVIARLKEFRDVRALGFVCDAIRRTKEQLAVNVPLIGFSGAPFTLASYMIEGGRSKSFEKTRMLMKKDAGLWNGLMRNLSRAVVKYLEAQIDAGADAVQIFDSWAGCLSREEYCRYVLPHMKRLIRWLGKRVPVIHFGTGTGPFLKDFASSGADVIGIDHNVSLGKAWRTIGHRRAVQGNLDPRILFQSPRSIRESVKKILAEAGDRPGFIFNLGHGVLPKTPEAHARLVVDLVHELSSK